MTPRHFRMGSSALQLPRSACVIALSCVMLLCAGSSVAAPGSTPEITTNASGANSLRIEYRPTSCRLDTVHVGNVSYSRVRFDEAVYRLPGKETGLPDVPYRQIPLAFPTRQGGDVRIVAADYEEIRGVTVIPVPKMKSRDGFLEVAEYAQRNDGPSGRIPESIATLVAPAQVRSALIGGVRLWPVQYDPATHTLRKYTRIIAEVTFGGGRSEPVRASDVAMLGNGVSNPGMMQQWQVSDASLQKVVATSSVLASGDWYRITVPSEGIYKIDASYLSAAGIATGSIDPRTIKIYSNGGKELDEDVNASRPSDLVENAIYIEGESDGQMNSGDYILFYGNGTRGLRYDASARALRHYIHHYSEVNYYWLTFGGARGKRMATQASLNANPDNIVEQFNDAIYSEEEKINLLSSGKDWLGQSITGPSGSFTYVNALPGLVTNDLIVYRYSLVAHDETVPAFTVKDNGVTLGTYYPGTSANETYATGGVWQSTGTSTLTNGTSQFTVTFNSSSSASDAWIDWFEILYPRMLWAVDNYLRFRSPARTGIAEFRLQQFTASPMIFNVTDYANVQLISGVSGSYSFRDSTRASTLTEYCAAGPSAWKAPAGIQKMPNQDLHGFTAGAEFVILTSSEFKTVAERLKTYRSSAAGGGLSTVVVDVNDVYNEFSGGVPDITAIRDYLKYAYTTWTQKPVYVLFFGGGSYDYKGILGSKSSFVPTWQSPESRHDVDSYSTDDYLSAFGGDMIPWIASGRIPSRTLSEATTVVDKLIRYDADGLRDSWKTRAVFVGDDGWTSEGGDIEGPIHSNDAETASSASITPDEFEKKKIYIAEYPTVYTAAGRRKPGAAQDIIDNINQGALIVNYSGHGNPKVWAHEDIFDVSTSIPQLVNADRLSLFFVATCNFSAFDDPKINTGSSLLLNKADGGAVGVISATRKVYQGPNALLNQGTYRYMYLRDAYGRLTLLRASQALMLYKMAVYNGDNDQKFFYMGDPTTRLAYPSGFVSIDSINGQSVDSVGGSLRTTPVTLKALSRVSISGSVRNSQNLPDTSFKGTVSLRINDVSRTRTIVDFYPGYNWQYLAQGGTIYKGENSISNGRFRASFIVPKDISYADTTGTGRVMAYTTRTENDGTGFTSEIRIMGADSSAGNDTQGPTLKIALGNRSFRSGDVVDDHPTLIVDLHDSSGINTSTASIGHRIEAWINNTTESVDLTDHYTSTLDDFRNGTVQMSLSNLPPGRNTIRIRAWDSFNNSATAETYFEVASSSQLSITDVFNYPNPFSDETSFTFRHNQQSSLDVDVKIYTIAGRMIQNLHTVTNGEMMVRVPWDGRDRDGDRVANGVYLYKVIVRTIDGAYGSEALGKMSIAR
jgi:hypothetical protein